MAKPLSPAAQAVKDHFLANVSISLEHGIAAALRTAADQVVPQQLAIPDGDLTEQTYRWYERFGTRRQLLAIADELEGNV